MPDLAELEEENEKATARLSIAEKTALIREARRRHGTDFKRFFSGWKSGIDWQALKFRIK